MKYFSIILSILLSILLMRCANFHTVERGKLYRMAQPSVEQIDGFHGEYKIRTIINLRGANPDRKEYVAEKKAADFWSIDLVDIGMSAQRLPHRADLIKLLDTFKTAKRPILMHCRAGVDRTGEASAIYKMEYMGVSKEEALKQLRIWPYGHVKWKFPAKRYFIKLYQGEKWAREVYDPCVQNYKYYDKAKFCK